MTPIIAETNDTDVLDALYEDNALTIEGLSEDSYQAFAEWVDRYTKFKDIPMLYVISGNTMNLYCGLRGNDKYKGDLHIVAFKLEDMVDPAKVIMPRFDIGARWFNDIVDNNRRLSRKRSK